MNKTYIDREYYLEKVRPYINKNVIKVIIGQRRVGKSYFLLQIIGLLKKKKVKKENIIYINKELNKFDSVKNYKDLLYFIKKQKKGVRGKKYILIDEIQEITEFEKALRSLQVSERFDIYCTGSNAHLLSGELSTKLSGRCIEIKIYSLSYNEFLTFHTLKNNNNSLIKYMRYGGLPYLIHLELTDTVIYEYLKNIYQAILYKDIISRYKVRHSEFLERLVQYLADNTGSIVSAKKISDFLNSQKIKMSPNGVLNYISYLTSSFFIFKVRRSQVGGKKIFELREKYYFEDLGLRHSIIGYRQTDINKILENIVFLHLKIRGYAITVGQLKNTEIDFVCEKSGDIVYVQVSYMIPNEKVKQREFGNLLNIKDNYRKIVVSMDETAGGTYKGIEHLKLIDFLHRY